MLEDACGAAGVHLGAYDYRILVWLTTWEPSTCAVVAGLISRARQADSPASADQRAEATRLAEVRAVLAEFDWEFVDRQLALERIERIVTAGQS